MAVTGTYLIKRLTDEELARQLSLLENEFGMTSAEFLARYNAGELGDRPAFIRWSGLLRIAAKVGSPTSAPGVSA